MAPLVMKRWFVFWLVFALACGMPAASASPEPIAIIVNKLNPIEELSWKTLKRIYSGRRSDWSSGQKIVVTNRPVQSSIRKDFYEKALGVKPSKKYFQRGSPIPFKTTRLNSGRAARKFVARVPNAIGYVHLSAVDASVKVLKMDGRIPTESDYLLR